MEIVGVVLEWNLSQRRDAIGSVSRVELGQFRVQESILNSREDPVPQALVEWHASAPGSSRDHHARAEGGGGIRVRKRAQNPGEHLGSVLSIAVEKHNDVEPSANRVAEAELLVSSIPLVERGREDLEAGDLRLQVGGHVHGTVCALVVDDVDGRQMGDQLGGDSA